MLRLRLPTDGLWMPSPTLSKGGDQPDLRSLGNSNNNLTMPEELCFSSYSRACAMRKSLQHFRSTTASSGSSSLATRAGPSESPSKKPRLVQTANVPVVRGSMEGPISHSSAINIRGTSTATPTAAAPVAAAAGPGPNLHPTVVHGPPEPPSSASQPPRAPLELPLLLTNCRVLDVEAGVYMGGLQQVLIQGRLIREVRPMGPTGPASAATGDLAAWEAEGGVGVAPAVEVDCGGAVLMPGLCDAHVHCTAVTANLAGLMSLPESYVATKSAHILAGMLARGFTTVRDAGGADFGLAQAVEEGLVLGPRILFTGHALSQTGGHGDFRSGGEEVCACGAALRGIGRVCDGDAEVRRAARDELRRGAHCIKVMASGGVASPTDRLTNTQFSEAELTAIVEEAAAAGTYVCAHAYTPAAIQRAVRCGVASIEHGNYLDEPTARLMSQRCVYLVPTLVTYQEIVRCGAASGMPQELVAKVGDAVDAGLRSLSVAAKAGVRICFGSDLLGDMHPSQALEFELRSRVLSSIDILRSATTNCAALFGMQRSLGRVRPGYVADLLLLRPGVDPLADVAVLAAPGGAAVAAVFKEGLLVKAPMQLLARAPAAAAAAIRVGDVGGAAEGAATNLDVQAVTAAAAAAAAAAGRDGCSRSWVDGWADLNQHLVTFCR